MTLFVTPTEDAVELALWSFLTLLVPSTVSIIRAQVNRVPEPKGTDFIVFTPVYQERLSFNFDSAADVCFVGSIAGTVLTVTQLLLGTILNGSTLFGTGVTTNTVILTQASGSPGGIGTYNVDTSQTVSSTRMASGALVRAQQVQATFQLDIHGDAGGDTSRIVSTMFFDDYAVEQFAALNTMVSPLFCNDPKQMPFSNAEQQYEDRWVMEVTMQVNSVVTAPQQYADALAVELVNVDASYPPA